MDKKQFQQAINKVYGNPEFSPAMQRQVMNQIKGGVKVKKKLSLSLVLAILLIILLATVAVAVMYWRDTAQKIAPIAAEKGYFEDWPAEERVELLRILNEAGALQDDARTPEKSAIEIAKAHVMETYGATEGENGLPRLERYIFFDITDPNQPLWRVQYMGRESQGEEKYESNGYVVFVDATNGEVIDSVKWDADVEFMFPDAFI